MQQQRTSNSSARWMPKPAALAVGAAIAVASGTSGIALVGGLGDDTPAPPAPSDSTWLLAPSSQSVGSAAQSQPAPGSGSARVPAQVAAPQAPVAPPRTVSRNVEVMAPPPAQPGPAPADTGPTQPPPESPTGGGVQVVRMTLPQPPGNQQSANEAKQQQQQETLQSQREEADEASTPASEKDHGPPSTIADEDFPPDPEVDRGTTDEGQAEKPGTSDKTEKSEKADDEQRFEAAVASTYGIQQAGVHRAENDPKKSDAQQSVTSADADECRPVKEHLDLDVVWNGSGKITKVVISGLPVPCVNVPIQLVLDMRGKAEDIAVTIRVTREREIVFEPEQPVNPWRVQSVSVRRVTA